MNFSVLPPEINSALMFAGAGSAPMIEAASAWDGLASELDSAAQSFSSVTSSVTSQAWQGPASQAMAAAAVPYASWLNAASAQASGASAQAQAVVGAFESALAATVPPAAISANRSNFISMVVSNIFGQNAPAIAAIEGHYEEMWAADVTAMVGYHSGASAAAAELQSWPATAESEFQNLGFVNYGAGNIGIGNRGFTNIGLFNTGNLNVGIGNFGAYNVGIGNAGQFNIGIGLTGTGRVGIGGFGFGYGSGYGY